LPLAAPLGKNAGYKKYQGIHPAIVLARVRNALKRKEVAAFFKELVCAKSSEVAETTALLDVRVRRSVRMLCLDREIARRQTSANAGRATDFTRNCITRGDGLSILKCDGYSVRTRWQSVGPAELTATYCPSAPRFLMAFSKNMRKRPV
jgi:hypothetical protein